MSLSLLQRRYLFVQAPVGAAVVNGLLNGAIGWFVTPGISELPVWGIPGVALDLIATAFGVAFGTCLGAVLQVRWDTAKGKITAPTEPPFATFLARLPPSPMKRALLLGLVCVPLFVPPVLTGLAVSGIDSLSRMSFVATKTVFAALEGALVAPFALLATLSLGARRGSA